MKLSELEALVKAIKKNSKKLGISNPDVTFWDESRDALVKEIEKKVPFIKFDLSSDLIDEIPENTIFTVNGYGSILLPINVLP